jgi:hypothetical protein
LYNSLLKVFQAERIDTGEIFAVKVINKEKVDSKIKKVRIFYLKNDHLYYRGILKARYSP